jgi:hypothetical protein
MELQGWKRELLYFYGNCILHRNVETILGQAYAQIHLGESGPATESETGLPVLLIHSALLPMKNCHLVCHYSSKDVILPKYWNCHTKVLWMTILAAPKAMHTSEDKETSISAPYLLDDTRD